MPRLNFERYVPFSPEQMLSLVADLEAYPEFVPNCSHMQVSQAGQERDVQLAHMAISFGPISQSYTSRVTIDERAAIVHSQAIDGPFSHLISEWRFEAEGEGTRIFLQIDFDFTNRLIAAAARPVFAQKQGEILDAFMAEAKRRFA